MRHFKKSLKKRMDQYLYLARASKADWCSKELLIYALNWCEYAIEMTQSILGCSVLLSSGLRRSLHHCLSHCLQRHAAHCLPRLQSHFLEIVVREGECFQTWCFQMNKASKSILSEATSAVYRIKANATRKEEVSPYLLRNLPIRISPLLAILVNLTVWQ